ncbi:hypothetical protein ACWEBX_03205 [Streptomyces sp. NPDC005070]
MDTPQGSGNAPQQHSPEQSEQHCQQGAQQHSRRRLFEVRGPAPAAWAFASSLLVQAAGTMPRAIPHGPGGGLALTCLAGGVLLVSGVRRYRY